jgi:hypothetical protein
MLARKNTFPGEAGLYVEVLTNPYSAKWPNEKS